MGIAIIVPVDFSNANLGKVTIQGNVPITSLNISGPLEVTGSANAAVYRPTFTPINTTQRNVSWEIVTGGSYASIDANTGALSVIDGATQQPVTIRCSSVDNSSITADKNIVVTYLSPSEGYIQNGLIAHFDAINKGNSGDPTKWVDLVGGIVATANSSPVFGDYNTNDYATFENGNYMVMNSAVPVTNVNYTIEVCFVKIGAPANEVIFMSGISSLDATAIFALWGNGSYIITGRNSSEQKCWVSSLVYPQTASVVNQQKCVINGSAANLSETSNYYNGDFRQIGAGHNGSNPFNGKIYSIRIYDRALTDAEITNNRQTDILRFGL